jgi:hypothetical protein
MPFIHQELWRLELSTWQWDLLAIKGGPTARSGHRMVAIKGRIVLFGGWVGMHRV